LNALICQHRVDHAHVGSGPQPGGDFVAIAGPLHNPLAHWRKVTFFHPQIMGQRAFKMIVRARKLLPVRQFLAQQQAVAAADQEKLALVGGKDQAAR
jgi:hypothetical protein